MAKAGEGSKGQAKAKGKDQVKSRVPRPPGRPGPGGGVYGDAFAYKLGKAVVAQDALMIRSVVTPVQPPPPPPFRGWAAVPPRR